MGRDSTLIRLNGSRELPTIRRMLRLSTHRPLMPILDTIMETPAVTITEVARKARILSAYFELDQGAEQVAVLAGDLERLAYSA